ncbi:hypothetical protein COU76_00850 [Candidatus Peregrinibacteria bacterium CG10_big_fil_rev_8_21_14_0_10_49_10]|nr:MAG: hypothetical protein COU76_00850 [Candidatus Peregrinibacteria bacterium CG10_big_fil_rev_8_21_14_0_10_49_10]
MKTVSAVLSIIMLFCMYVPVSLGYALSGNTCENLIGPAKARCLLQQNQPEGISTKEWKQQHTSELIRERSQQQRSRPASGRTTRQSAVGVAKERMKQLAKETAKNEKNAEKRNSDLAARKKAVAADRLLKLRERFTSIQQKTANRTDGATIRARIQEMRSQTQEMRNATKEDYLTCRELGIGKDRIECLSTVREKYRKK